MKANDPLFRSVCGLILFGLAAADTRPTVAASPSTTTVSGESACVIRMANSQDGLFFEESGDILLTNAVNPSLVRLPDGSILAMFKINDPSDKKTSPGSLAVSRTLDEGRSWSRPRKVRLQSRDNRPIEPGYVSMISTPQGHLKLYFIADAQSGKQPTGSSRPQTAILSAVSRNGLDFAIDPSPIVPITKPGRFIQTACAWNHHVYLYVSPDCSSDSTKERKESAVLSLTSQDGRKFKETKTVGLNEVQSFHCALNGGSYLRAYVSTPEGICSLISKDADRWTPEKGIRFKQGWNPAVIQRKDKSYLMLYCAKPDESTRGKAGLAMAGNTSTDGQSLDQGDWKPFTDAPIQNSLGSDEGSASSGIAQAAPSGAACSETNSSPSPDNLYSATAGSEDFFAPLPDFANRVDYLQWFLQQVPQDCSDNAYNAYASFMPMRVNDPNSATWPASINDMFNGNYSGPIQPWNPQEHPEWETTHQSMADLLAKFRDATRHDGYAEPIQFSETPMVPGDERLLGEILLPSLSRHRTMVKATLSDAWRAEGGVVSPERMTDAFETCLRNSSHLNQSFTLIHQLVSMAESNMVGNNALKALQHNVFSTPEQLERTLNTLQLYDHFDPSPDRWLKCESGSAMQIFQQMYTSNSPNEPPQLDVNRYSSLAPLLGLAGNMEVSDEEAAILKAQDPRQAVQQMKETYQQINELWKTGYPLVRASDFSNGVEKSIVESGHPLVRMFMPSFSRAYSQTARNEASRRATQLSYSVHLFKARNGRWPNSLDELPPEHGQTMKVDPFSGGYFNYRMTDNGPTIYSSSENGRDDGGVHSPRWADNVQDGQSDDYVFWPPQK